MNLVFYLSSILTLFILPTSASQTTWNEEPSGFTGLLRKLYNKSAMTLTGQHPQLSIDSVRKPENIVIVRKAMDETNMTLIKLCTTLSNGFVLPQHTKLINDYYMEQRAASSASGIFDDFDVRFYDRLHYLQTLSENSRWTWLKDVSSEEEVMCEAMYFYDLIDFERAITCLDTAPSIPLNQKAFAIFIADMYLGEAKRSDFVYEDDIEGRKRLDEMIGKYQGDSSIYMSSLMRRFTRNIRGKVDDELWIKYMRAMMTVNLSAAMIWMNRNGAKDLYGYLFLNDIQDEYMFSSDVKDSVTWHTFLRTFKLDPNGWTATMGIINSGYGLNSHDESLFKLHELPDTISEDRNDVLVYRYIPFVVYDAVPKSDWGPVYITADSLDKAYFGHKQKKHEFRDYQPWQYIDDQRAGTCTGMSLWRGLYWFERESQQRLESFKLALHLEILKAAAKELTKLRTELEELDTQRLESASVEHRWDKLQARIKERSETEDDFLLFFSVAFNSAIRSIRYLHSDPFDQGLYMTPIMRNYADFYESQEDKRYWQLVKPNIDDLYNSTYVRILPPKDTPSASITKISAKERDCVNEVNQAIKANDPFNFVKAVISGTDFKCQSKDFLASIHFGVGELDLQTHHEDLILRALAKEIRLLRGGRIAVLRLVVKLVNDHDFKLFPSYDISKSASVDFTEESHQVVLFEDDAEMKQFAVNCAAFDLLGKNVLSAAYGLAKSALKSLPGLETRVNIGDTEEFKLCKSLVESAATELQSIDPHIYAQYLASLIWNVEETGIADYITLFSLSKEWNRDDYELLEHVAKRGGSHRKDLIRVQLDHFYDFIIGRELGSKYSFVPPDDLPINEYTHTRSVTRAVDANSSLDFVRAVISGVDRECESELFLSSITFGMDTLNLQCYHKDLILQTLLRHKNVPQMLKFIDKLVVKHGVKLFSRDNTLPSVDGDTYDVPDFFLRAIYIENEDEVRQFVADLNKNESTASIVLKKCTEHKDLVELRSHFVNHIFEELQGMSPRLYAYHLSRLINQKALHLDDFASTTFKLSEGWDDYDYVLIKNAIKSDLRREEYSKIFNFPKKYRINTKYARKESEFELMSANPSDETLMEYAKMLFKKTKKTLGKKKKKVRVESGHKG